MSRKKKDASVAEATRAKIAESLPHAIDHALQSYRQFYALEKLDPDQAKEFSARHTACKAAIAHIELLLKLAQWAHLPRDAEDNGLAALLADAQNELARYRGEGDGDA